MALLLPILVLLGLFALALLLWPLQLWRRVRDGHLRRRVYLWPYRVRRIALLFALAMYVAIASMLGDDRAAAIRELWLAIGTGLALGLAAAALAKVECQGDALFLSPNRVMVALVALVLLARLAWIVQHWWGEGGDARTHAVALGGALLAFALAHSATLTRRLRNACMRGAASSR